MELVPHFTLSFMDDDFKNRSHWLAGELAKAASVSTDTLRHYERKGVLKKPNRRANGYRLYPADALNRVLLVRRALSVGFTLDELARLLSERDKGGVPCKQAYNLAVEKLSDVEEQLLVLTALRDELRHMLSDWNKRLSTAPSNTQVGLLETLVSNSAGKKQSLTNGNNGNGKLSPKLKSRKKGR